MSRKRAFYASIAVAVPLLGSYLAKPAPDVIEGERRLCVWRYAAIDVLSTPSVFGGPKGELCQVWIEGVDIAFESLSATEPNSILNMGAIREGYAASTGASGKPARNISLDTVLTLPQLLSSNRVPLSVYVAPGQRRGFLIAEITDRLAIVGLWASDRPIMASQITDLVRVRINPKGELPRLSIFTKLIYLTLVAFSCLPLGVVWFHKSIFRSIDQWWNIRTVPGFTVYGILIPATLIGFTWVVLQLQGWATGFFLAAALVTIAVVQVVYNLYADRRTRWPLDLSDTQDPRIFSTFGLVTQELDVANAPVPLDRWIEIRMWFPRLVACSGCGARYTVYVPATAKQFVSRYLDKDRELPPELHRQLHMQAIEAAPMLVNGCIRCGCPITDAPQERSVRREDWIAVDWKVMLITLGSSTFAVLVALFNAPLVELVERLPFLGGLFGYIFDELSWLAVSLLMIPLIVLVWQVIARVADRSANRGGGPFRMYACRDEGLIFEDIAVERDPVCPSCQGALEPLRRFDISRA